MWFKFGGIWIGHVLRNQTDTSGWAETHIENGINLSAILIPHGLYRAFN